MMQYKTYVSTTRGPGPRRHDMSTILHIYSQIQDGNCPQEYPIMHAGVFLPKVTANSHDRENGFMPNEVIYSSVDLRIGL